MGNFSGLISGFIIEWLGSHLSLFIAATCVWGGLFSIWLVVMGVIPCSVPVLCCFIYLAQFGGSLTSQTSSSTSLSIFPSLFQYKIASIAKGFSGISGAVISAIAGAYFEDSPNLFILFASAFIPISIFGGAFVVPDIPPNGREHFKEPTLTISQRITPYYYHFICLLLSSIVTALLPLFSVPYLPIISKVCGTFMVVWLALIFIVPSYLYITNFHAKFQKIISSYLSWIGSERYTSVPDSTHSTTVTSDDQVVNPVIEMRNLEDGTENNSWSNIQTTEQSIPSKYPNYNVCLLSFSFS